jgi:hypothetical protein
MILISCLNYSLYDIGRLIVKVKKIRQRNYAQQQLAVPACSSCSKEIAYLETFRQVLLYFDKCCKEIEARLHDTLHLQ